MEENKIIGIKIPFSQKVFLCNGVDSRIEEITMLIRNTLSDNLEFKTTYPNSRCWAGFVGFALSEKKMLFDISHQKRRSDGHVRYVYIGKMEMDLEDGNTDDAVVKAVNTWFADFLKKKQNA